MFPDLRRQNRVLVQFEQQRQYFRKTVGVECHSRLVCILASAGRNQRGDELVVERLAAQVHGHDDVQEVITAYGLDHTR